MYISKGYLGLSVRIERGAHLQDSVFSCWYIEHRGREFQRNAWKRKKIALKGEGACTEGTTPPTQNHKHTHTHTHITIRQRI